MIVWALWTRKAWPNGGKVKLHQRARVVGVNLRTIVNSKKPLLFQIMFNVGNFLRLGSNESQVVDRLRIDWEESHSCTILWRHVSDCSSVGQRKIGTAGTKEFHELSNNTSLSKHGSNGKNQICGSGLGW